MIKAKNVENNSNLNNTLKYTTKDTNLKIKHCKILSVQMVSNGLIVVLFVRKRET